MLQQNLLLIGFALIIIGFVLVFVASMVVPNVVPKNSNAQTKAAFVGFIGPFPIGFGTDKQTLYVALAIGIVIFVAFLIINLMARR